MCYTKFRRSGSNHLGVGKGHKNGDAGLRLLGTGNGWPLEIRSVPHVCHLTKFGCSRSNRIGTRMGPTKFGGGRWPLFWYGDVAEPSKYASSQLYYLPYSVIPSVFSSYFEENTLIHYHNTRQKHQFHISFVSSECGKRTIKYKGIKLENNLPVDIKETKSLQSFKDKIQEFILQSWVYWSVFVLNDYTLSMNVCLIDLFTLVIGLLMYVMAQSCFVCFFVCFALFCLFFFHCIYC